MREKGKKSSLYCLFSIFCLHFFLVFFCCSLFGLRKNFQTTPLHFFFLLPRRKTVRFLNALSDFILKVGGGGIVSFLAIDSLPTSISKSKNKNFFWQFSTNGSAMTVKNEAAGESRKIDLILIRK